MKSSSLRAGASLLEAVLAIFLLLISLLIVINLFHSSIGYLPRIENQQLAGMIAERQLEQLRVWSETPNGTLYNYDNPGLSATYNGTNISVPDQPHMRLATNVTAAQLYSPCSQFELNVVPSPPLIQRRVLSNWASKVKVTVSWDNGTHQVSAHTLFARPATAFRNDLNRVIVTVGGPTTLRDGESTTLSAVGYDINDNPIPNLLFSWDVCGVNATGKLEQARDGSVANLTNRIFVPPFTAAQTPPYSGVPSFSVGELYVRATARYHGQEASVNSTLINLIP